MAKAKETKQERVNGWRNRITGYGEQPASQFLAHELNARRHPNAQRDVLRGSLSQLGWIDPVIVSERTGKTLDGHARIEEALSKDENAPVPFVTVDISDEEERLALATLDPIAGLAYYDQQAQAELLEGLEAEDQALDAMLEAMRAESDLAIAASSAANNAAGKRGLTQRVVVKAAISVTENDIVEAALLATSVRNRGGALAEVCRYYLDAKGLLNAEGQLDVYPEAELEAQAA